MTESAAAPSGLTSTLKGQATFLLTFLAILWGIAAIDYMLGGSLKQWGVHPRTGQGAVGILFAPFLHGNFTHLAQNSIPLIVLGWLVMIHGPGAFARVTTAGTLVGGAGTWLIGGTDTNHVGASVLIFGFFGYLVLAGVFQRSLKGLLLSAFVVVFYGTMVFGVLPTTGSNVSWEMHLFGAIGGALAAWSEAQPDDGK